MRKMSLILLLIVTTFVPVFGANPILPGYFADPSAYKFGGTYYIYSTSDGYNVNQTAGWPCVWMSDDFLNWSAIKMDIRNPDGSIYTDAKKFFWAPSALEHNDKYYLFFTMSDYYTMVAESDTPDGTFTVLGNLFGTSLETKPYNKTIDAQVFKDDDGKVYLVYLLRENPHDGDNVLYTAIAQLDSNDLTKVLHVEKIEELSYRYREGQEILKYNDKYYMLYSHGWWRDKSYHVRYAMADDIYGPYEEIGTILSSSEDGTIYGTGHHSVLKDGDRHIMVYHRQFTPFLGPGFRQVAADEMKFAPDGKIIPVVPTQAGVGALRPVVQQLKNISGNAKVIFSGSVDELYKPEYLIDGSYATLWKTEDNDFPSSVVVGLKGKYELTQTELYFEYPSKYYQYTIETSADGEKWETYADRIDNTEAGSPKKDVGIKTARFLKLTFFGMEDMSDTYGVIEAIGSDPKTIDRSIPRVGIFDFKIYGQPVKSN